MKRGTAVMLFDEAFVYVDEGEKRFGFYSSGNKNFVQRIFLEGFRLSKWKKRIEGCGR